MLNNLRAVLMLQVALPLLIVLGVMVYVGLWTLETTSRHRLQQDIGLIARVIGAPVSDALNRGDTRQAEAYVRTISKIGRVYSAYLFDAKGHMLTAEGSIEPARRHGPQVRRIVQTGGRQGRYEQIRGRHVYSYFLPLFNRAGTPNGLLQITRRRSDFAAQFAKLRHRAWALFAAISLLVLGGISITHRWAIGRYVSELLQSMKRVERGEVRHRSSGRGPRELRDLASGLNRMLDAMHLARMRSVRQRRARTRMAKRLREAERMAALGELSAGVAHELGAPLSVVDGRALRISRRIADPEISEEIATIRAQVSRMSDIVSQLLAFGRSRPGKLSRIGAKALIEETLAEAGTGPVVLGSIDDCEFYGDALRLRQALGNLLRNAWQSRAGASITVTASCDRTELCIHVDDDGPGVPRDIRERILAPFFTTKPAGEGSGLGLAIVSSVIREHDGRLDVDDSPAGGARFTLRLPVAHIPEEVS